MAYLGFIPTATILPYAGASAPEGWLVCDGQAVSRTTFASLYAALGGASSPFGQGDGSTTFNLPDLRGRFPRFDDNMGSHGVAGVAAAGAAGRDSGRTHGSAQAQATAKNGLSGSADLTNLAHTHSFTQYGGGNLGHIVAPVGSGFASPDSGNGSTANLNSSAASGTMNHGHTLTVSSTDAETRPINLAVSAIIKI